MDSELEPRPASSALYEWAEFALALVSVGFVLDQWTNGAVREVLASFFDRTVAIVEHLPSHSQVSDVLRRAEAITREAADRGRGEKA